MISGCRDGESNNSRPWKQALAWRRSLCGWNKLCLQVVGSSINSWMIHLHQDWSSSIQFHQEQLFFIPTIKIFSKLTIVSQARSCRLLVGGHCGLAGNLTPVENMFYTLFWQAVFWVGIYSGAVEDKLAQFTDVCRFAFPPHYHISTNQDHITIKMWKISWWESYFLLSTHSSSSSKYSSRYIVYSLANISVFVMSHANFGYYIHGEMMLAI